MDALIGIPGVEVAGSASNGRLALARMAELKPDLVTLDIEMPEIDGLQVLDEMNRTGIKAGVIIVSALSVKGGRLTVSALEKGAFDFITKPDGQGMEPNIRAVHDALMPIVKAFRRQKEIRSILSGAHSPTVISSPLPISAPPPALPRTPEKSSWTGPSKKPEMVLIGVSTGGPNALARLVPAFPADLAVPVLIVQHMPPLFTRSLADSLASKSSLRVREASHGELAEPGTVYIAPGGRQMKVAPDASGRKIIQITDDPPENNCKPAVDYLFRSAAHHFPGKSLAVIMTGMGSDGTLGLRLLKRHGCQVIAQDEASCVVFSMPRSAIEAGVADAVVPLDGIASRIAALVQKRAL
jgi:two-component system chemotaxis response regulator CheB